MDRIVGSIGAANIPIGSRRRIAFVATQTNPPTKANADTNRKERNGMEWNGMEWIRRKSLSASQIQTAPIPNRQANQNRTSSSKNIKKEPGLDGHAAERDSQVRRSEEKLEPLPRRPFTSLTPQPNWTSNDSNNPPPRQRNPTSVKIDAYSIPTSPRRRE